MDLNNLLKKYADLIIKTGINVQPGQTIILYADVDQAPLARLIVEAAYAAKANEVILKWNDPIIQRQYLQNTSVDRLQHPYEFEKVAAKELMDKHASRISLLSASPEALNGIDPQRIHISQTAQSKVKQPVTKATMNNDISWLVVAGASLEWAQKVYPNLSNQEALNKLWESILTISRVTLDEPNRAWQEHIAFLNQRAKWLNDYQFDALHYQSDQTDLTIGLPENHLWEGAGSNDKAGNFFVPNIPTEEVFTAPDYRRIDGVVAATYPLSNNGQLITNIKLTFKDGHVIKATADQGADFLNQLIKTDVGASSLGEIALVPEDSPIAKTKTIFYNTLFDENASDHLALGAAYPFSIQNGTNMDANQLKEVGLNQSEIHVDFMIGSNKMNIDGITKDGQKIPIMRNGNWV